MILIKKIRDFINRYKLRKSDKKLSEEIQLAKKLLEIYKSRTSTYKPYQSLIRVYLYLCVVVRDIYYLAELYHFEKDSNRKNFYARLICMSTYELIDDVNNLLGKDLISELEKSNLQIFISDIKELNKHFSSIRKEYGNTLRIIRNEASAHKNKDPLIILEAHNQVEKINITNLCFKISITHAYFMDVIFIKIIKRIYEQNEDK